MRREWLVLLAVLLVSGLAFAESVVLEYGEEVAKTYELNDSLPLWIGVNDVPAHVHQLYIDISPDLVEHVYCAPGAVVEDENDEWDAEFACILLPGTYEGRIVIRPRDIDVDADGNPLADREDTVVRISVSRKDVWYTSYGYTGVGGSLTVGQYRIEVEDAEPVSAEVTVYRGSTPVWAGLLFVGQELELSDDFIMVFNGYSERRGRAFFTFKTRFPVSVSSSVEDYYVAVPPVVYAGEGNTAEVVVRTNCSEVEVCSDGNCARYRSDDGSVSFSVSVGEYEVRCVGADVSGRVKVLFPVVVTKTVEREPDLSKECPSWFYNLSAPAKRSYCSAVCDYTPSSATSTSVVPPGSDLAKWIGVLVVLAVVGYFVWKKHKEGGLSFGRSGKEFEETEKEVEAVPDIEG